MNSKKRTSKPSENTKIRVSGIVVGNEKEKTTASNAKKNRNKKPDAVSSEMAFWTKVLGVATLVLVFIGFLTAGILSCQIREMRIENKLDQRAWVMPIKIDTPSGNIKWFKLTFQNTGKTPALEVSGWTFLDNKFDWDEGSKEPFPLKCLIPPNGTITDYPFNNTDLSPIAYTSKISRKEKCVFYFGKLWYKDIFGESHWIEFSYRLIPVNGDTANLGELGFSIQPWGDHNKTDDKQTQQ